MLLEIIGPIALIACAIVLSIFIGFLIARREPKIGSENTEIHVCGNNNHRFVPRYDVTSPFSEETIQLLVSALLSMEDITEDIIDIAQASKSQKYIMDVCIFCGITAIPHN